MAIKKAAVLGSGVMGSGIAAHLASAGVEVLLLDIVPKEGGRNALAEGALEKLKKSKPALMTHPKKLNNITPGNLDDDLEKLKECDWIIEVVLEKLEIKHSVYQKIAPYRRANAIVSSNTSTIPLHSLIEPMDEGFKEHFMITHFFNPVRYMRLLEIVQGEKTSAEAVKRIKQFVHQDLGKGYVFCHDTPGFIANRIGVFWLTLGLLEAMEQGVSVEVADAVMSRPVGIPKTGVFGLFDLIGIDLMPLIAKELKDALPDSDAFCQLYAEPALVTQMIADGYTGRKGKGGFYRLNKEGGKKIKEAINLQTGEYSSAQKPKLASVAAAKDGLQKLVEHEDEGGAYARAVLLPMLHYSAMLAGEIADDIVAIDRAMRWGYNWKFGPFELIDKLGTAWFAQWCEQNGMPVPSIIQKAEGKPLYEATRALALDGTYQSIMQPAGVLLLSDVTRDKKPVKKNGSARLWDIGDGVLQLEYTSKMNSMDPDILSMMQDSVDIVKEGFQGMVIGGGEGTHFSVGANLAFFLFTANTASWSMLSDVIRQGQNALMGLKHAPFPVVAATHGMAVGGGCETVLHCDAVQAHIETYPGLVEVGVGVVPGWGGCKELLFRAFSGKKKGFFGGGPLPATKQVFETIGLAKVGESAELAKDLGFLNEKSRISMNRDRLLQDAKNLALELAKDYEAPEVGTIKLAGKAGRVALDMAVKGMAALGKVTEHDATVVSHLAQVLTGGDYDSTKELTEQDILDLEHDHFMQLVKLPKTLDRIEYMLENNKPLRN